MVQCLCSVWGCFQDISMISFCWIYVLMMFECWRGTVVRFRNFYFEKKCFCVYSHFSVVFSCEITTFILLRLFRKKWGLRNYCAWIEMCWKCKFTCSNFEFDWMWLSGLRFRILLMNMWLAWWSFCDGYCSILLFWKVWNCLICCCVKWIHLFLLNVIESRLVGSVCITTKQSGFYEWMALGMTSEWGLKWIQFVWLFPHLISL